MATMRVITVSFLNNYNTRNSNPTGIQEKSSRKMKYAENEVNYLEVTECSDSPCNRQDFHSD